MYCSHTTALFKAHPVSWIPFFPLLLPSQLLNCSLVDYKIFMFHHIAAQKIISSDRALFSLSIVSDITTKLVVRPFKRGGKGWSRRRSLCRRRVGMPGFSGPAARSSGSAGRAGMRRDAPGCRAP